MSTELNQLLQIRNQKENKQRQIVQHTELEIVKRKKIQQSSKQSLEVFKSQKGLLENSLFNQINNQQISPDALSEYQHKINLLDQFGKNLKTQQQAIVTEIQNLEASLNQTRQKMVIAIKSAEKIRILVESEQLTMAKKQARAEDLKADDQASEAWLHALKA